MKVGDMVTRKTPTGHPQTGPGIILSKQLAGKPEHMCLTVYYPKVNKTYDIAESLVEVYASA